jgi:hypothetical protein
MDLIQHFALIGTLWKGLLVDAFFAGTFNQIADFEIVFKFERFFWHGNSLIQYAQFQSEPYVDTRPSLAIFQGGVITYHRIAYLSSRNSPRHDQACLSG